MGFYIDSIPSHSDTAHVANATDPGSVQNSSINGQSILHVIRGPALRSCIEAVTGLVSITIQLTMVFHCLACWPLCDFNEVHFKHQPTKKTWAECGFRGFHPNAFDTLSIYTLYKHIHLHNTYTTHPGITTLDMLSIMSIHLYIHIYIQWNLTIKTTYGTSKWS